MTSTEPQRYRIWNSMRLKNMDRRVAFCYEKDERFTREANEERAAYAWLAGHVDKVMASNLISLFLKGHAELAFGMMVAIGLPIKN